MNAIVNLNWDSLFAEARAIPILEVAERLGARLKRAGVEQVFVCADVQPLISRAQAKVRGLQHYFTGMPCIRGHLAMRTTRDKSCVDCHRERSSATYYANHDANKARARELYPEKYAKNPEKWAAAVVRYRQRFPDRVKERDRKWRTANADKINAAQNRRRAKDPEKTREAWRIAAKARRAANPELAREKERAARQRDDTEKRRERERARYFRDKEHRRALNRKYIAASFAADPEGVRQKRREWYLRNRDAAKKQANVWRKNNPEKRLAAHHKRRALKRGSGGSHTAADVAAIRKAQKDSCAYCRVKLRGGGHIDHIVALSKGGSNDKTNIQITCGACNLRKHTRDPIEFAQSMGMLL